MLRLGPAFVFSQLPKPITRSRDLEKTTVPWWVKNVHSFCGNRSFTISRHWAISHGISGRVWQNNIKCMLQSYFIK